MQITERSFQFERVARQQKHRQALLLCICILPFAFLLSLSIGAVDVSLWQMLASFSGDLNDVTSESNMQAMQRAIVFEIRMPRILMTMLTGAGLAICGVVLQSIFRNPLADPGLIGVSSCAALFAALGFFISSIFIVSEWLLPYFIPVMAFIGALASVCLLFAVAGRNKQVNTLMLILAGVAINAGAMTLLGIITVIVDDSTLRQISFWSMGSYAGISASVSVMTTFVIFVGAYLLWQQKNALMLMAIGEKQAKFQGIDTERVKIRSLIIVSAMIAVCVSFTGIVGFVGLVVPHICRMLSTSHLKVLMPMCAMAGAILVCLADTLARMVIAPSELPVGLITSVIGVPVFVALIYQEKRKQMDV